MEKGMEVHPIDSLELVMAKTKEKKEPRSTEHTVLLRRRTAKKLMEYLVKNGQVLMPMVELVEASRLAIDELIDVFNQHHSHQGRYLEVYALENIDGNESGNDSRRPRGF